MSERKRKSCTPEYRHDAAHLVIDNWTPIATIAREIGVGEQLLGRWVTVERSRLDDPPGALDVSERAELERAAGWRQRAPNGPGLPEKATAFFVSLIYHADEPLWDDGRPPYDDLESVLSESSQGSDPLSSATEAVPAQWGWPSSAGKLGGHSAGDQPRLDQSIRL